MRIAIAGFGTESSTFSRHSMKAEHFSVHTGDELLGLYDLAAWIPDGDDIEWLPVFRAHGGAGGPLDPAAFERFRDEIVEGIRALGPVDGVYFDLHGAAHVADRDHAEEELLRGVREAVGPAAVISMSMDTHGNFSRELAEQVDLAVAFRHAPHIDAWPIRERAVQKLVEVIRSGRKPLKAWVRVPVLLPGERTSTLVEPAKTAFGALEPMLDRPGIVDVSMWVGFAWADEDRNGGAVMVTGYDEAVIVEAAEELAHHYWDPRHGFVVVSDHSGTWDEGLDFALTRPAAPLFLSDAGDNVTAGSAGDITLALHATLARPDVLDSGLRILFAGMTDPASVAAAVEAGVGGTVSRGIGAVVDDRFGGPVVRDWTVVRFIEGIYEGEGVIGALLEADGVHVMIQQGRSYFVDPAVIGPMTGRRLPGHAWMPIEGYDAVVVKNGYLFPDQQNRAGSWFMALTPGGTDVTIERLDFARVDRPIYPLDDDFEPDLTPVVLPAIG
jgi:microcystin degradation protein MlrC